MSQFISSEGLKILIAPGNSYTMVETLPRKYETEHLQVRSRCYSNRGMSGGPARVEHYFKALSL